MTTGTTESSYRWYILFLGTTTHIFVAALPLACIPVLLPEIAADLNLSLVQVGMVWGIINLPGMFLSIFGGMLGDRYGTGRVLAVFCLFTAITCALRGIASGYTSLLMFSILFGTAQIPLTITVHKAAGQWFSDRQLGMANGILAMGMGAGGILASMISATIMSPLLGGWRNVMFVYAVVSVIFTVLWFQTRNRQASQINPDIFTGTVSFKQAFLHVIKIKPVWIIACTQIFFSVFRGGITGYLPTYLEDLGWTTVEASGALTALSAASAIGVIPLSMMSDRLGLRKSILIPAYLVICICIALLSVNNSAVIWPMVILMGFFIEGIAAITITLTMESSGVGATYAGTALGLVSSASKLGGVVGPPVGNQLAAVRPVYGFTFWAITSAVSAILFFFVKETGRRKKQAGV